MNPGRELLKALARAAATIAVAPALASYWIRSAIVGRDRALQGSTQALALVPGIPGQYLRRAFLTRALARCHSSAVVEFGTIFSQADAEIGENAYIGAHCHLGLVHIGRDALREQLGALRDARADAFRDRPAGRQRAAWSAEARKPERVRQVQHGAGA